MQKMGFSDRWVDWIMSCVTSVRYSVKLNGTLLDSFAPMHGLQQGDPLSPFLFLFVADGLSSILRQQVMANAITPLKICRRAPGISHLLFADDTLLFFKASQEQALEVKKALDLYNTATGQSLNYNKCSLFFGTSCPESVQAEVRLTLQVTSTSFEERYLGLPTPEGRLSKGRFQSLQTSLTKRLIQWGDGHLAQPGRETLIKSVALSLPTHIMGLFKLPYSLCDDLTRMIRNFYWGSAKGKRKVHWKGWDHVLQPKSKGGVGFRDLRLFNQAFLSRQAWRLITRPESLCARVLKAKYYPNGKLEDTVFTGNSSSSWQAISHGLDLLKKGLLWRVGNGTSIRIWRDNWIPRPFSYKPISAQRRCRIRYVADLLNENGSWKYDQVSKYFAAANVSEILKIKASPRQEEDVLAWEPGRFGRFSVKSSYDMAFEEAHRSRAVASSTNPSGNKSLWRLIWSTEVPPTVCNFAWRLVSNSLPTWQNKHKIGLEVSSLCPVCALEPDDNFHPMVRCPLARQLYGAMAEVWRLPPIEAMKNS
uniref:Reverse transcriptase domain-containing protein n=1 Tax=Aegilops tauschii subsp. strangulata TaxID=200361 RepID=A0A453EAU8_AEGTS